ncbi:MAG: CoA transferase [Albidovulum sp.]|nr:CoA transferase [Albidovulum sp.]
MNSESDTAKSALDGVRILDFSQMMMGPLCTQTLADLGADVIKVERPETGDWMRGMPMVGEFVGSDSAAFHAFNRNKRSLTVDLKNEVGRKALLAISRKCDVVVENFRSGVMDRLGLGYADFKEVNPGIIYASGSGWGSGSKMAEQGLPGQDLLVQAMSGVMFHTGRDGDPPTACGTPIADFAASQSLAIGILVALIGRDRHGVGQKIETNLFSATLGVMAQENFAVANQDVNLRRSKAGIASCWNDAPYGNYRTSDGWIAIAMCPLDKLGALIGDDSLGELDPWEQRDEAKRRIDACIEKLATNEWMMKFRAADIWAAPVRTSRQAMRELADADSDRLVTMKHPEAGEVTAIACPIAMSEMPAREPRAAPLVGQHTEEILNQFLSEDEISELRDAEAL